MRAKVAVYENQHEAVVAVKQLKEAGFPMKEVSLVGKAEIVDDNLTVRSLDPVKNAPVAVGAGAGVIMGALAGLGIFAIPGFGFLYGAGALIGAIAGFDFGIMGGGLVSALMHIGIKEESVLEFEEHLNQGRFIVVVNGPLEDIEKAEQVLHTQGTHLQWNGA